MRVWHRKLLGSSIGAQALLAMLAFTVEGLRAQGQSPSDLIRFLTYQSAGRAVPDTLTFSCGETEESREDLSAAKSLVRIGAPAVPDIDRALDAIDRADKGSSHNAGLLLVAYGTIRGRAALPRLRAMIHNPKLDFSCQDWTAPSQFRSTLPPTCPTAQGWPLRPGRSRSAGRRSHEMRWTR